jgi:DNA-binding GntR family transcriptional regulator
MDAPNVTISGPRQRSRGKVMISRLSLHERVAQRLREMIVSGELKGGEKVPVSALSKEIGVSLTPLREALKVLAEEQLVELSPNRGARVVPVTPEEARSIFEVISALEGAAAELAAKRMTAEQLATMENLHARMRAHYLAGEREPYFRLNREIHNAIVEYAGNPILLHMRSKLSAHAERIRFMAVMEGTRRPQAMQDHEDLMEAFRKRDGRQAMEIWRRHLAVAGACFGVNKTPDERG